MILGLDYSYDHPSVNISTLKASPYKFVLRYLTFSTTVNGSNKDLKRIHLPEMIKLREAGLIVGLNWEFTIGDQLRGALGGTIDAKEAVRQARALGYPEHCQIVFSTDFDATPVQLRAVDAYMTAAKKVCNDNGYLCGQYGGWKTIKHSFDLGICQAGWQSYAWSGAIDLIRQGFKPDAYTDVVILRGNKYWFDRRAALRQVRNGVRVAGGDTDIDEMHHEAWLWGFC